MSSPLSMLKKMKRTPFQDPVEEHRASQKVPFRRNLSKELRGQTDDESSDPHPPLTSHTPARHASTPKPKVPSKKGAPPSDFELMSAMMKRVTLLEKTVRSQAREIESKDKRITFLKEILQKESESIHDGRDNLVRWCLQLRNQVYEIESFLNDYGLIWVGEGESSGSPEIQQLLHTERGPWQPDASAVGNFHMNFDLVLQRIEELNFLAGENECFVQSTITGAQFAKRNPIRLSLYSNGVIFDGPFRSYQEHSAQQCMQDIMNGYFPSELQERFPHGVPFEVYDRRDEEFILRGPWNQFPGEGLAVGGENNEAGKKQSVDQFQRKLPKVVEQAGHVIDMRDSLRHALQGSTNGQNSNSVVLIETPALHTMKHRLETNRPASAHDVITLKVKSEHGNQTYTLKMYLSETIGQLRQYVDQHRGCSPSGYDIISAYPQYWYDDDSQMLQSCGLTTNVTLLLRKRKQPHCRQ